MIVSESQFKRDTQVNEYKVLIERAFSRTLGEEEYIFLSHKHEEEEYVFRVESILKRYGFNGYVDWRDDTMPKVTAGETALKLKERIRIARKFIFIASEKAIASKWCNWEVGYADAQKYIQHIAIFPIKEDYLEFSGQEYLSIYPSIQIQPVNVETSNLTYYVRYPNGRTVRLADWLNA
jgi:hypothetical protein